jgi:Tfp pilus assembly protein PilF
MKNILILILITFSLSVIGQQLTFENWTKQSENNIRLLPKYGEIEKTKKQKKSDKEFIKETMKSFKTENEASNHMIDLGFKYLYKDDLKTAMYRFNQAYLLDNNNSNIYWGYGALYMSFGKFDLSREQYEEGLKLDHKNDKILIDYGTTYLGEFYKNIETDSVKSIECLDKAIEKLSKAYSFNPKNTNSSYKLSICYLYKNDCSKANEFLNASEELGNPNITVAYKNELEEKCSQNNMDCSTLKTGKFEINDEISGITKIERTEQFQIEENTKLGYKLKLKVTWINDCTYQLQPIEDLLNPENKDLPTMIVTSKITEITDKGYIQVSSSNIDPTKVKTELTKVK